MRALFLALILALSAAAATLARDGAQPAGTIDVEDDANTDAAIAVRTRGILAQLERCGDVTVTASAGTVTRRGEPADAEAAGALAGPVGRVAGVVAIENEVVATCRIRPEDETADLIYENARLD